jgi:CRISPR-associated protein Cmr6
MKANRDSSKQKVFFIFKNILNLNNTENLNLLFNKLVVLLPYENKIIFEALLENKEINNKNEVLKEILTRCSLKKHLKVSEWILNNLNSLNEEPISITTNSRLALGLGLPSFFENGITLHHIYGVPYIPASSFKGFLRFTFLTVVLNIIPAEESELLENLQLPLKESNNNPKEVNEVLEALEENPFAIIAYFEEQLINSKDEKEFIENLQKPFEVTLPYKGFKGKKTAEGKDIKPRTYRVGKFLDLLAQVDEEKLKAIYYLYRFLFGTQYHRGGVIYFDSFPERFKLEVDIMNPHYSEYYENLPKIAGDENSKISKDQLIYLIGDWHNPKPIFFLTIGQGAKFKFFYKLDEYFFEKLKNQQEVEKLLNPNNQEKEIEFDKQIKRLIEALLKTGLEWWGIGAKKRKGYGNMERIEEQSTGNN